MKKRIVLILLLMIVMLFTACASQPVNENLLLNPGFESGTGTDVEGWYVNRYYTEPPIEYYQAIEDPSAPEGTNVIKIESVDYNDASFVQEIEVEPDSYYCLTAMVKTEFIEQRSADSGAHIGFLQTHCKSQYIKSYTDWTKVTVYGQTDSETTTTKVALRLGDYSADAKGKVYFDDVSLMRLDSLPGGVSAISMTPFSFQQSQSSSSGTTKTSEEIDQIETDQLLNTTVVGLVIFIIFFAVLFWAYREFDFKMTALYVFVAIALLIRFVAATMFTGFDVDIGCFSFWGELMAKRGMENFYSEVNFCDYPPLYMIVLGFVSSLGNIFSVNLQEGIGLAFLKSPAIICDAIAAIMIGMIGKKHLGEKMGVVLGIAYALLPTAILNSAIWGQVDSILVLFMLITFWLIDNDQFGCSVVTFAVGLLFKPQAILFGPVMLLVAIHEFYVIYLDFASKNKKSAQMRLIKGFGGLGVSILLFVILSFSMQGTQSATWLIDKYFETLGSYDYATLSSFGLMGMLDGQWTESSVEVFDGVTYSALGTGLLWLVGIGVVAIFGYLLYTSFKNKHGKTTIQTGWFWLLAALMVAGAVTVSTRTHERYMFPVIAMLLVSFIHFKDIRLLFISAGYAVLNYINVAGLLFIYTETKKHTEGGFPRYFANGSEDFWDVVFTEGKEPLLSETIFVIGSWLTVILFIFQVYVTVKLLFKDAKEIKLAYKDDRCKRLFERRTHRLPKVKKQDVLICLAITVVYACVAFTNLGDVEAAQTYWYTDRSEVYVVADLGEVKDFDSIKYLSNSASGTANFYTSEDGEIYTLYQNAVLTNSNGWKKVGERGKARYVRIEVDSETCINELVILKDETPLPIKSVEQKIVPSDRINADAWNLFDDQEAYIPENIPKTIWASGGNYIVNLQTPLSFTGIEAYVSEASDVTIAIPMLVEAEDGSIVEEWRDVVKISDTYEKGWTTGFISDVPFDSIEKFLIKNNNKTSVGEISFKSDRPLRIAYITDEEGVAAVEEDHDVYNCFDEGEKEVLPETTWESGGNYIVNFKEPVFFSSIEAYVPVMCDGEIKIAISAPVQGEDGQLVDEWHDAITIDSKNQGWIRGTQTDVGFDVVSSILIKNADNMPINELAFIKGQNIKIANITDENGNLVDKSHDVYNCFDETIIEKAPETKWTSGGNFVVNFSGTVSFSNIAAYGEAGNTIKVAIPIPYYDADGQIISEEWVDILTVNTDGKDWTDGTLIETDEYLHNVNKVLIKNPDNTVINEMKFLSDMPVTVASITKEDGSPVEKEHDVYNCFDETKIEEANEPMYFGRNWCVTSLADYVIVDFGQVKDVQRSYYKASLCEGTFSVFYSNDGEYWNSSSVKKIEKSQLYSWESLDFVGEARYVLITADSPFLKLIEVGFFETKESMEPIKIQEVIAYNTLESGGNKLFDEQHLVPGEGKTYLNSTYFDEIYHARTAYESVNGHSIYEWTHPPLGKDMMSWCISLMGMTPFAWRFAGTLAGVLMLPAIYFLALLLFKKTSWATTAALLMASDGMHYAQTRIATIDSFGVLFIILMFLFMYWYYSLSFYDTPLIKTFIPLGLCGLSFGLGAASKWIGLYAGAGLAVIFFITIFRRWSEYEMARKAIYSATGERQRYLNHIIASFYKNTGYTILFCIGAFIIVPLIIYCLSYYPYWNAEGETREWYTIIMDNQKAMFDYHSQLEATHPYQSAWYTWPVMETPMFFYVGPAAEGEMATIYSFGNPVVWFAGLYCALACIAIFVKRIFKPQMAFIKTRNVGGIFGWFLPGDENDQDVHERDTRTLIFLLIGLACNLMPWIGISRCIFIYHYFASVPFIILFTVYVLRHIARYTTESSAIITTVFVVSVIIVFFMFLPVWTGTPVSKSYIGQWVRWLPSWFGFYFPKG